VSATEPRYPADPRVDAYIDALPGWQRAIITGGHGNKTARTVAVREDETIKTAALTAMFRQIIANNRAGGWRKLKREAESGAGG
jgi:hypothetical protein